MSLVDYETREEKEAWLMCPLNWAANVCGSGGGISALMWYNGDVSMGSIAVVSIGSLLIAFGLLIWGIVRIQNAARRRY